MCSGGSSRQRPPETRALLTASHLLLLCKSLVEERAVGSKWFEMCPDTCKLCYSGGVQVRGDWPGDGELLGGRQCAVQCGMRGDHCAVVRVWI